MNNLFQSEIFVGLLSTIVGAVFTYLGIASKNRNDVTGIYTAEIRNVIDELKNANSRKDEEISRLEELTENLKNQLEQALELVDMLQKEREEIKVDIDKKDKQIETLTKLVNALRK